MSIPKSGKISLSEIVVNFNPSSNNSPHSISEYYRAPPNGNVKDFVSNTSIPMYRSGTPREIKWSDFHGTGLQSEYYWPIPELCTDSFHLFSKGVENWDQVQDSTNEYVGRDDTEASMIIPVFNQAATITIPALKFEIGSELGDDLRYERILENTSTVAKELGLPTTSFAPGQWQMIVPKKFKRLRIMISSGGGSGSVQKTTVSGDELKNKKTKGIVEQGFDGRDSAIWMENASIELRGGAGGGDVSEESGVKKTGNLYDQTISTPENPIVVGGFATSYENKSADTPAEYIVSNTMVPANGSISFGRNNFPINILHKVSYVDNRGHALNRESGLGEDSLFGTGGAPGIEYTYSGDRQVPITQISDTSFGVGGAAGQHGGRGSEESGYTGTEAGQAGVTGYFGDFEVEGGDIINISVGAGGRNSENQFQDFDPETVEAGVGGFQGSTSTRISESGYGGNGVVQIIGSYGHSHSKLSHPGWILEDENGNILSSSYARSVSVRGVTTFQGSMTSSRSVDVIGSDDVNNPKMYRLRFSARIGKNGDMPMKTTFCHIGKKSVKVEVLGRKIFLNSPAVEGLYNNPDTSLTVEQVTGNYRPREVTDFENIDNWFTSTCDVKFELTHRGSYSNTATFTKVASTAVPEARGGGPSSFTLSRSQSVIEFTMASQERYVLKPQHLNGTGRNKSSSNRLASFVRSRNQMQLDESGGMNSFANADMAITYTGMGGFYLSSNTFSPVKIDKTNSEASGIQNHHLAHRINHRNGNGAALSSYNSNWTIGGGTIGAPKALNRANFPQLWEYKTVVKDSEGEGGLDYNYQVEWIKDGWESLARSIFSDTGGATNTTHFSCGYRGNDTTGQGTTVAHTWVKKKDKWWDINLCFLAGTMVTMEDGTKKAIETIDLGESVKIGGRIFACGKFLCDDLHDYHGIKVSGSHMVLENNKWIRVEQSSDSTLISNDIVHTYNFGTENRRLEIEGITFTDYFEIDEQLKLEKLGNKYFENWTDDMIERNKEVVDIINE